MVLKLGLTREDFIVIGMDGLETLDLIELDLNRLVFVDEPFDNVRRGEGTPTRFDGVVGYEAREDPSFYRPSLTKLVHRTQRVERGASL